MSIRPWMPFYPSDWLGSVRARMLTSAQRGIYIDLLCAQWELGVIPASAAECLAWCARDAIERDVSLVLARFFEETAGGLANRKLADLRRAAEEKGAKAREAAAASHAARRANAIADAPAIAIAIAPPNAIATRAHDQTPESRLQSPEPLPEPEEPWAGAPGSCAEPLPAKRRNRSTPKDEPGTGIVFPLRTHANGNEEPDTWDLPASLLAELSDTYRHLDVEGEIRKARIWCQTNAGSRKTARGMPAFLNGWLGRARGTGTNGAGMHPRTQANAAAVASFLRRADE